MVVHTVHPSLQTDATLHSNLMPRISCQTIQMGRMISSYTMYRPVLQRASRSIRTTYRQTMIHTTHPSRQTGVISHLNLMLQILCQTIPTGRMTSSYMIGKQA